MDNGGRSVVRGRRDGLLRAAPRNGLGVEKPIVGLRQAAKRSATFPFFPPNTSAPKAFTDFLQVSKSQIARFLNFRFLAPVFGVYFHKAMTKAIPLLLLAGCGVGLCQEIEGLRTGEVLVTAPAAIHAQPKNSAVVLGTVARDTKLRWVEGQKSGGFLRVVGDKGAPGWISEANVSVISSAPGPGVVSPESAAPPCAGTLDQCPAVGCADDGSTHGIFNQAKRRKPTGDTPVTITFADLASLQSQADKLVGEGGELTLDDRAQLKNLPVAAGTVDEGSLVQLVGFIATGPLSPHANTGESVNCRLKTPANNDFHISFVADPNGTEFDSIVVEMIPQDRPAGWTLPKLSKMKQQRKQILVRGALFYDNEHVVNADANNEAAGQPRRFALWEIHPITEFLVCRKTTGTCNPNSAADWAAFADVK
jgi:hypothetical protein